MEAEFSKQMCRRLADYKYHVTTECKSPLLQKEKVLVDREELLQLIDDLFAFHSVDQHLEEPAELEVGTVQLAKEQILKNAVWQARQMVSEAEVVRKETLESALEDARKEAERILNDAKNYDTKVKAEAEEIVNMTLTERRQELEAARKALDDSREQVLAEARQQGEQILEETRKEAENLQQRLDEEIEQYRKTREAELKETLQEAQQLAQSTLEEKTRDALQLYTDAVHKTEDMVDRMMSLYEQQINIIQQDRKEIEGIIEKLERQNLHQGLQRGKRF